MGDHSPSLPEASSASGSRKKSGFVGYSARMDHGAVVSEKTSSPDSEKQKRFAPVLDASLEVCLNSVGNIEWSFGNTFAARVLGRERAKTMWNLVAGKLPIVLIYVCMVLTSIVISVLHVFMVVEIEETPGWRETYLVFISLFIYILLLTSCIFIDLRLFKWILRSFGFLANMTVVLVATLCLSDMWNFDSRAMVCVVLCFIVFYTCNLDTFPPDVRRLLGVPILALMCLTFITLSTTLILGRFPQQVDHVRNLGTLGELAQGNVTLSIIQIASDNTLGFFVLVFRLLIHQIRARRTGELSSIHLPIEIALSNPDTDKFGILDTSWISAFEGVRRFFTCRYFCPTRENRDVRTEETQEEQLPPPLRLVEVRDQRLAQLMDERGRLTWSFESTFFSKIFGTKRALRYLEFILGGSKAKYKIIFYVFMINAWAVGTVWMVFAYHTVVPGLQYTYVAATGFIYVQVLVVTLAFYDLRIVRACAGHAQFYIQPVLCLVGNICFALIWSIDARASVCGVLVTLVMLVSAMDACLPEIRLVLAFPILLLGCISILTVLTLLALNRFPDQTNVIIDLGTMGGLAARPVTMTLEQVAMDLMVVNFFLLLRSCHHAFYYPNEAVILHLPLVGDDDPDFVHFPWLGQRILQTVRRVSKLKLLSRRFSRPPSEMDTSIVPRVQEDVA